MFFRITKLTVLAVVFESGIGLFAWLAMNILGISLSPQGNGEVEFHLSFLGWGGLAALPLISLMVVLDRISSGPWGELRDLIRRDIVPQFARLSLLELAVISLAAGVGEELLFRGFIQNGIASWFGSTWGALFALAVASLLFGFAHSISSAYVIAATLVGLYLGSLALSFGNIWVPMATHSVYDFLALVYLVRNHKELAGTQLR